MAKSIETINEELKVKGNELADKIASEMNFNSAQDLMDDANARMSSNESYEKRSGERLAGDFTSKLSLVMFEQVIYSGLGSKDVYSWVNKFTGPFMDFGNSIQFQNLLGTNAKNYNLNEFIPQGLTNPEIEVFTAQFLKNDQILSETSYQYKKSLSLNNKDWMVYFKSGKLDEFISKIIEQMQKTYRYFVANQLQQLLKKLGSGDAQVNLANAGVNGKNLKLKKVTSAANDTFAALNDFLIALNDLTNDVNKTTIAADSKNIGSVALEDLVIFVPKKLAAKFNSAILTRLPSAQFFNTEDIFNSERMVQIGAELKTVKDNTNNVIDVVANSTPFLSDNKILVVEKEAIKHMLLVNQSESQYFAENMINQLTIHIWGFFAILPFKKGFLFECNNLLTDPN